MKYFFILGNNPTLSIAEISAVFPSANSGQVVDNIFVAEIKEKIDAKALIKRLGGAIKIGSIKVETKNENPEKIKEEIIKLFKPGQGKFKFGISYYGQKKFDTKKLGLEIKKYLQAKNISCRWVTSREKNLSSVVVEQNKLIGRGVEIILAKDKNKILIGQTQAVQPFKELSFRDYGRPARDDKSGMLPPKLAQIMINLSLIPSPYEGEGARRAGEVILDPFCGSGTILTEAILMGCQNLIGSDISQKAISDTEKNIEWTSDKLKVKSKKLKVFKSDVAKLSNFLEPNSVDVVVTEPYLGPQRGKINLKKVIPELEKLYSDSLAEFKKILKPNGRIVMVWPIFRLKPNTHHLTPNLNNFKIVNPIPKHLRDNPNIKLTNRNTIIYGREGQKVWREIVVLEK